MNRAQKWENSTFSLLMLFLPDPPVSFQKLLVIPTGEPAQRAKRDWMAMLMKAFGTDWSVPQWCGLLRPKRINGGIFSLWIPVCLFGRWYQSYAQTWARGSNESTQNYPISTLKMIRLVCVCFSNAGDWTQGLPIPGECFTTELQLQHPCSSASLLSSSSSIRSLIS